jgi:3',5'-cyclic AMP phosphodiesterase CpdA
MTNRREFLAGFGALGVAAGMPGMAWAEPASQDFDFLFFTDTHLEPERDGVKGCDMAFRKMQTMKADFAIQGGDHVYDALECPPERARELFKLYDKTQQDLSLKVHHAIGNHDLFGVFPKSGVKPTDADFGKRYFEEHIGKTYYSFDHKGVHFVVLDSVGITDDRSYEGRMDATQIAWLKKDLEAQVKGTPVIVTTHIPLVTAADAYMPPPAKPYAHQGLRVANGFEVLPLLEQHNVVAVLQGHHHINERVDWHGIPYITSGAVCGNWWQGTRLGTPEGFSMVSWRGGKLSVRYETYGFQTVDPHNT